MTIRNAVLRQFRVVAEHQGKAVPDLDDNVRLSESGLDSLCLAIIVSNLFDELDLDPFDGGTGLPITVGEFVELYEHAAA